MNRTESASEWTNCLTIAELDDLHARAGDHPHVVTCLRCREAIAVLEKDRAFLRRFGVGAAPSEAFESGQPVPETVGLRSENRHRLGLGVGVEREELPGFRMMEAIHRGGQGTVYRAIHEASCRKVAMKVLEVGSARRRARMEREAQLAAALSHPNIVTLLDCGDLSDGRYALAMELIEGRPLDDWAKSLEESSASSRQRTRRLLEVFLKLCRAIEHAHRHGVIHRDLKPDNVLVDAEGEPHVVDFGVAVRCDRADARSGLGRVTVTGELACTLSYASPEQVTGDPSNVDERSDVYALGRILYELVTGRPPYPVEGSIGDIIRSITSLEPAPMRGRGMTCGRVGRDLEIVALKALAKDPDHRYRSAAELADDIQHVLDGEAIAARRDSVWYRFRKILRRHRVPLAAAVVATIGLAAGGVAIVAAVMAGTRATARAKVEQARSQAEAERSRTVAAVLGSLLPAEHRWADFATTSDSHRAVAALSERLESSFFCGDLEGAATTRMILGEACLDRGAPRMAEEQSRLAVRHLLLRESPEDAKLAAAMHGLAAVLLVRRELPEAQERATHALSLRRRLLGERHAETVGSLALLARVQLARGALDEAAATAEAVDMPRAGRFSPEELAMAGLLEVRAEIEAARNRFDAARSLAEEALRVRLRHGADADPGLPRSLGVLAGVEEAQSPSEAAVLRRAAHELATLPTSAPSPRTLRTLLVLKDHLLGRDDADRLETLAALAPRLRLCAEYDEALATVNEAVDLATRLYGEVDLRVADLLLERVMIEAWLPGDRGALAADCVRRLAILRALLPGVDDFYLGLHMRETASILEAHGFHRESDSLHEEAIDLLECRFGPVSRELAWCIALRGATLAHRGVVDDRQEDFDRGMRLVEDGLAMQDSIDPGPNYYSLRLHRWLGWNCTDQGRFDEGRWHFERAASIANESVFGPEVKATMTER